MPSNFPLPYRLSWLPRFLVPSLRGDRSGFAPPTGGTRSKPGLTIRLVFIGDISAVAGRKAPEVDGRLSAKIASADLVIGNCESPVVARAYRRPGTMLGTRHAMTPQYLADALAAAAIEPRKLVLSLANNHALDQGAAGFAETRSTLERFGIRTIGATADGLVRTVAAGPLTIGFVAFTEWLNASAAEFSGRVVTAADFERNGWSALGGTRADLLCAVPHWDLEFRHFPRAATRSLATRLAGSGVGLIVGGHAHVVQPAERIGDTLVAYGLGDFLGTAWPRTGWPLRIGAMLVADIGADEPGKGTVASYEIVPFVRLKAGGRERLAAVETVGEALLRKVEERWLTIFGG